MMIHRCFWHRHPGCKCGSSPKTRAGYSEDKFRGSDVRARESQSALRDLGYRVMLIGEFETNDHEAVAARMASYA